MIFVVHKNVFIIHSEERWLCKLLSHHENSTGCHNSHELILRGIEEMESKGENMFPNYVSESETENM